MGRWLGDVYIYIYIYEIKPLIGGAIYNYMYIHGSTYTKTFSEKRTDVGRVSKSSALRGSFRNYFVFVATSSRDCTREQYRFYDFRSSSALYRR